MAGLKIYTIPSIGLEGEWLNETRKIDLKVTKNVESIDEAECRRRIVENIIKENKLKFLLSHKKRTIGRDIAKNRVLVTMMKKFWPILRQMTNLFNLNDRTKCFGSLLFQYHTIFAI